MGTCARSVLQIVPTNRPGFITPLGSRACLTRSASAQSGRGSPQTRSRSFQSVGQRERIRLPPSRTAAARRRSISGASVVQVESARARGPGRSRCPRAPGPPSAPGRGPSTNATTDEGRRLATKLTGPTSAAWNSVRADQSGPASPPSRIDDVGPAQLVREAVDLPGDRGGVVLEADDQDPAVGRQAERPRRRAAAAGGFSSSRAIGRVRRGVQPVEAPGRGRRRSANGTQTSAEASGIGPDLQGQLGDDAERAQRAGQELGEVVAGDVLDDPPAPLDDAPRRR